MKALRTTLPVVVASIAFACQSTSTPSASAPTVPQPDPNAAFEKRAEAMYWHLMDSQPGTAVDLGHHQYDGRLADVSRQALTAEIAWLKAARTELEAMLGLNERNETDRRLLIAEIRRQLFELDARRMPMRSPLFYTFTFSLTSYMSRDYAPVEERARAIVRTCEGAGDFFGTAQKNLPEAMPKTWVQTGLLMSRGMVSFVKEDVVPAMDGLTEAQTAALRAGLAECAKALEGFVAFLELRMETADDDFRLGKDAFLAMLEEKEGLKITREALEAIADADLERNLAAMKVATAKIDDEAPMRAVVERVASEKPAMGKTIELADQQAARMRSFLRTEDVVSIPSDDVAEIEPTPKFMRWNAAFLDGAGPFEEKALPSFYYISPPDPSWPKAKQQAYVPAKTDLLFITIHELWPGHFLHSLHAKTSPSMIAKSFCSYSMAEGWAHYTEEMMWEMGVGDGDPEVHVGQLMNALLRNVRFKSALGLHMGDMTVEASQALFREKAFQDDGNAEQQAMRGTFDPGYLNYTLGKLMIMQLRQDYEAKLGAEYSPQRFHDDFLAHQCAPVPLIRELMLGPDAGPAL